MSHLYDEIHQQPEVIARLIHEESRTIAHIADSLRQRELRYILIAARGTSDNAATYGKYLFASILRLPVALAAPSLYTIYHTPPHTGKDALVIGISQSGESPDIIAVVNEARQQGACTLAITNEPDSPLARTAEHAIICHAGKEMSVAASKTYTAQLTALALLAAYWSGDEQRKAQIQHLPEAVSKTLTIANDVRSRVERYRYMETCLILGRGYNYATAFEIALKMKELSYILIEAYSSADFMHGPIAVVEQGFPVILIAPSGEVYADMLNLARELHGKGAELIAISDQREALDLAVTPLKLPVTVPEWLSPITCVIPGQLLAHDLTLAKGYDPDHPRGLRKITLTH
ncbi:MAG: SIS domain-containing protein [Chloroflexi bacterium]|nr:SIS domain-containing protein [Chloroflexota bacterium]